MTDIPKPLLDYLEKAQYVEQTPGNWFILKVNDTEIAVDLRGEKPVVGVQIGGTIQEEGHGINRVQDIRNKVEYLWSKGAGSGKNVKKEAKPEPAPQPNQWKCGKCGTMNGEILDFCKDCGTARMPEKSLHEELKPKFDEKLAPKEAEVMEPEAKAPPVPARISKDDVEGQRAKEKFMVSVRGDNTQCSPAKREEATLTIDVIKQYLCPNATDAEAYNFLQLCHARGLNPFLKEAYLIKYGNGAASMVVGKDAFTRKAEDSPEFDGYEAGVVLISDGKFEDRIGTILRQKEELVGGWAKVYRKNTSKPFEVRVSLQEYDKHMNNWKTMPATMIRKVALVQALREAFTKELGGCYDKSEMGVDDVEPQAQEVAK